jgi:hypothetical protein
MICPLAVAVVRSDMVSRRRHGYLPTDGRGPYLRETGSDQRWSAVDLIEFGSKWAVVTIAHDVRVPAPAGERVELVPELVKNLQHPSARAYADPASVGGRRCFTKRIYPKITAAVILGCHHEAPDPWPISLVHLERIGIVSELTSRQRGRVFSYTRYTGILNEGMALPGGAARA